MKTSYSRTDMAEIWHAGLDDQERLVLVRQFREQHGGDAVPEPTAVELFDAFNAGTISLEDETTSGTPQDCAGGPFVGGRG